MFLIAFLLLIADMLIALALRGLLRRRGALPATTAAAAIALALLMAPQPSDGRSRLPEQEILAATETTHLAFVRTGVPQVDATSRAGLYGLTQILLRRTSVDVGDPVDASMSRSTSCPSIPFLYWPVTAGQRTPSPAGDRAS